MSKDNQRSTRPVCNLAFFVFLAPLKVSNKEIHVVIVLFFFFSPEVLTWLP